ncbi:MAG: hypothetical protein DHS20C01_21780 [marine bacterium B5-7]|nr:MAG: hypothetical protein DHS20C01_21780 [marine bacterium B5-7]
MTTADSLDDIGNPALGTDSRKVYILPTRFGMLYAGAILMMLLVSVNYNNGLGHLFTFMLVAIGIVAMHYTQRNLVGLSVSIHPGKPVFSGDMAQGSVRVHETRHRSRYALWLRGGDSQSRFDLPADGHTRIELNFKTGSRGWQPLPEIYFVSIFPVGLLCAWSKRLVQGPDNEVSQLVYPRPAAVWSSPISFDSQAHGAGNGSHADDGDFRGLRGHRKEDPPSRIHWRNSARGSGLVSKQFEGTGSAGICLDYADTRNTDHESRLSELCRWILDADSAGTSYALRLPGLSIAADQGGRHRARCLKALALCPDPANITQDDNP